MLWRNQSGVEAGLRWLRAVIRETFFSTASELKDAARAENQPVWRTFQMEPIASAGGLRRDELCGLRERVRTLQREQRLAPVDGPLLSRLPRTACLHCVLALARFSYCHTCLALVGT